MQQNAHFLADRSAEIGPFQLIGDGEEQLPLVAFNLAEDVPYDEFDIAWQVAAERGWMLPAYTMPPQADHVKMLRALVKLNLSHALVTRSPTTSPRPARRSRRRAARARRSASRSRPASATERHGVESPSWGDAAVEPRS